MPRTFSVEKAKSARSSCKKCKTKIDKSSLRMGIHSEGPDDRTITSWYHIQCFSESIRKGPTTTSDIQGYKTLNKTEKSEIQNFLFSTTSTSTKTHKKSEKKTKKRKRTHKKKKDESSSSSSSSSSSEEVSESASASEADDSENDGTPLKKRRKLNKTSNDNNDKKENDNENENEEEDEKSNDFENMNVVELRKRLKQCGLKTNGKKTDLIERLKEHSQGNDAEMEAKKLKIQEEKDKRKALKEELSTHNVNELKDMLRKNLVHMSGNKGDLIDRIADCKMYGSYPKCSKCGGGVLRVTYSSTYGHNGQGSWKCPGFYNDDQFETCDYKTTDPVERAPWKD